MNGAGLIGHPEPASQREFAAALLGAGQAVPAGLCTWNGSDPAARFAVHRNNVALSLVAALVDTFPVVRCLVGAEFFDAMARDFVRAHPPRSPVLAEYGEDLADWLVDFEPARDLPYLPEMARLERARVRAHHAADAAPLAHAVLAGAVTSPEGLACARVELHPSLQVLRARHAVVSLWQAHQVDDRDQAIAAVDLARPEDALVLRDADDVLVIKVSPATARFVQDLGAGCTLAAALPAEPFDAVAALALLIRHGALVAWHDPRAMP
jgi:hypothetical protein